VEERKRRTAMKLLTVRGCRDQDVTIRANAAAGASPRSAAMKPASGSLRMASFRRPASLAFNEFPLNFAK